MAGVTLTKDSTEVVKLSSSCSLEKREITSEGLMVRLKLEIPVVSKEKYDSVKGELSVENHGMNLN